MALKMRLIQHFKDENNIGEIQGKIHQLYIGFANWMKEFTNRMKGRNKWKKVELGFFFPIYQLEHYYLIVFDLKRIAVHVLDNRKDFPFENYLQVPRRLALFFSNYLLELKHPTYDQIIKAVPKALKLKWQTNFNDVDCAIFVMRHMETFKGGPLTRFDTGLPRESEEQVHQLRKLRKKYLTKILLSDINVRAGAVLTESNEFAAIPDNERKSILLDAYKKKDERLDMI